MSQPLACQIKDPGGGRVRGCDTPALYCSLIISRDPLTWWHQLLKEFGASHLHAHGHVSDVRVLISNHRLRYKTVSSHFDYTKLNVFFKM